MWVWYKCFESGNDHISEPKEPPPKTYTMKDKFEYFKPCVQVEMDNPDKQETVTEVFIRGQSSFFNFCGKIKTLQQWHFFFK